jgi:hypothetical protein
LSPFGRAIALNAILQRPGLKRVSVAALVNIAALIVILASSAVDIADQAIKTPVGWLPFLLLVITPYFAVVWMLERGRTALGCRLAITWSIVALFGPVLWLGSTSHRSASDTANWLTLLSVLLIPFQLIMLIGARKAIVAIESRMTWRMGLWCVATICCGLPLGLFGLISRPYKNWYFKSPASATATLRTLRAAEEAYAATYHHGFSLNLHKLCTPAKGDPTDDAADLADPIICAHGPEATSASFHKNDYYFYYSAPRAKGNIRSYTILAFPTVQGSSGLPSFFMDESGIIRRNDIHTATVKDAPL